jgi:ABC-2 type transport system ATP-binding protein
MLNIRGVVKKFDKVTALDGVNMTVKNGSIYGLVGTNGAGKTTILKLIAGILKADAGFVGIDGQPVYDSPDEKSRIAFIPDDLSFFGHYRASEAARYISGYYAGWDQSVFEAVLKELDLPRNRRISGFSKGMQKQVVFALALAAGTDYLILDEPIDGLDPIVRRAIWKYIVGASADRGMTTIVSSHNLREMEGFCDSIGIIDKGHMALERDLDELKSDLHKLQVSFGSHTPPPEGAYDRLRILNRQTIGSVDVLIVKENAASLDSFAEQYAPVLFDSVPLSLEEVFIYELGERHGTYIYEISGGQADEK